MQFKVKQACELNQEMILQEITMNSGVKMWFHYLNMHILLKYARIPPLRINLVYIDSHGKWTDVKMANYSSVGDPQNISLFWT